MGEERKEKKYGKKEINGIEDKENGEKGWVREEDRGRREIRKKCEKKIRKN